MKLYVELYTTSERTREKFVKDCKKTGISILEAIAGTGFFACVLELDLETNWIWMPCKGRIQSVPKNSLQRVGMRKDTAKFATSTANLLRKYGFDKAADRMKE